MKTINEFKNKLQVGVKLHTMHHLAFAGRDDNGKTIYTTKDLGTREVSIKQTNSFALKTTRENGQTVDSWCNYPKSKEVTFLENGISISEEDRDGKMIPVLTYTFID